jgi:hypothetical protein
VVKALVLLLALAFVAWRLWPKARLPWAVPVTVVAVLVVVRTLTWAFGDG